MSISSGLVKQLAGPVPTGVVDLVPLVQGRCCRSEHDEKLLLKAQAAHPRGWVVAACPCQYLPGDGVRVALVFIFAQGVEKLVWGKLIKSLVSQKR